jgi:hypothetical protein
MRFALVLFAIERNAHAKYACPCYLQCAIFFLGDALSHLGEATFVAGPKSAPASAAIRCEGLGLNRSHKR